MLHPGPRPWFFKTSMSEFFAFFVHLHTLTDDVWRCNALGLHGYEQEDRCTEPYRIPTSSSVWRADCWYFLLGDTWGRIRHLSFFFSDQKTADITHAAVVQFWSWLTVLDPPPRRPMNLVAMTSWRPHHVNTCIVLPIWVERPFIDMTWHGEL